MSIHSDIAYDWFHWVELSHCDIDWDRTWPTRPKMFLSGPLKKKNNNNLPTPVIVHTSEGCFCCRNNSCKTLSTAAGNSVPGSLARQGWYFLLLSSPAPLAANPLHYPEGSHFTMSKCPSCWCPCTHGVMCGSQDAVPVSPQLSA